MIKRWVTATLLMGPALACGQENPPSGTAHFEVASVKLSKTRPNELAGITHSPPARSSSALVSGIVIAGTPLRSILVHAYSLPVWQISFGSFDSVFNERFDIAAKTDHLVPLDQLKLMLQGLLRERLGLEVHREVRDIPVYELFVEESGLKAPRVDTEGDLDGIGSLGESHRVTGNVTLSRLARMLSLDLGRPVIDRTGLTDTFHISLVYGISDSVDAGPGATPLPSVFAAMREQLGLRLEANRRPIEMLIVDRVQKVPAAN